MLVVCEDTGVALVAAISARSKVWNEDDLMTIDSGKRQSWAKRTGHQCASASSA